MQVLPVEIQLVVMKKRFRQDLGNLEPLKESIQKLGLLHPIVVTPEWELIAGERRLKACKELGWEEIPAHVIDLERLLEAERDENDPEIRKDMTVSERTAIGLAIEKQIGNRQGERTDTQEPSLNNMQRPNGHNKTLVHEVTSEKTETELPVNVPEVETGQETRQVAAKGAGFGSEKQYRNAKKLKELGTQELKNAVDDNIVSISDAASICDQPHEWQNLAVQRKLYGHSKTAKSAIEAIKAEQQERSIELQPVSDRNGLNVPDNLRGYYDATPLFDEIKKLAKQLRLKLNELDRHEISKYRQLKLLQSYCKTIEYLMGVERFGIVCPFCHGLENGHCGCCEGKRWFPVLDISKVDLKKWSRK